MAVAEPRNALFLPKLYDHPQIFDPLLIPAVGDRQLVFLAGQERGMAAQIAKPLVVIYQGMIVRTMERSGARIGTLLRA